MAPRLLFRAVDGVKQVLRAENCNFFRGDVWAQRRHDDLEDAGRHLEMAWGPVLSLTVARAGQ
jgi:hypothetical protein